MAQADFDENAWPDETPTGAAPAPTPEPIAQPVFREDAWPDETPADALRRNYRSLPVSPDEVAKTRQLSQKTGLPPSTVRDTAAEAQYMADEPDWQSLSERARILSQRLAENPVLLHSAKDDTKTLAEIEELILSRGPKQDASLGAALRRGVQQVGVLGEMGGALIDRALTGAGSLFLPEPRAPYTGEGEVDASSGAAKAGLQQAIETYNALPRDRRLEIAAALAEEASARGEKMEGAADVVAYLAQNPMALVTFMAEQAPAGALGGGAGGLAVRGVASRVTSETGKRAVTGAGVGFGSNAAIVAPMEAAGYVGEGEDIDTALTKATTKALVEGVVNAPFSAAGAALPLGTTFAGRAGNAAARVPFEAAGGIAGAAAAAAVVGEDITYGELVLEGVMGAGTLAVDIPMEAITSAVEERGKAQKAKELGAFADALIKKAEASKLYQRDPDSFEQLVQAIADESGEAPTSFHVDAQELSEVLEQSGLTVDEFEQRVPALAGGKVVEALLEGGTVEIPVGQLMRLAGSGLEQNLLPRLRESPDGMSPLEAEAYFQDEQKKVRETAEKILADQKTTDDFRASADRVQQTIREQLVGTGRATDAYADTAAMLVRDFYVTNATKLGITPEELYQQYPLSVVGPKQQTAATEQVIEQGEVDTTAPAFRAWSNDAPLVKASESSSYQYQTGAKVVVEGFHGSPQAGFEAFADGPMFFSNRYDIAASHAGRYSDVEFAPEGAEFYDEQQAVYSVYLSLQNPLVVEWSGRDWGDGPEGLKLDDWANRARRLGHDGLIVRNVVDTGWRAAGLVADNGVGDVFVTFRPEQIKSATDNRGTFDPNSANILEQRVSTRLPTAKKATENPLEQNLSVGLEASKMDPAAFEKNVGIVSEYVNMRPGKEGESVDEKAERFIKHVADNLLWLHDAMPEEQRARAKLWYDGGRKIVEEWASRYGITEAQAAAAIAVLSPQKDWYMNVSTAERVLDILSSQQEFTWSEEMEAVAERVIKDDESAKQEEAVEEGEQPPTESRNQRVLGEIRGKRLGDLTDPYAKAMWVRMFDEAYNDRGHAVLTPEGGAAGPRVTGKGEPQKTAWGSFSEIAKAVSVFDDGRMSNISMKLGGQHKVRNFYNNLFDPTSEHGDVTIDTHAVAAGLLRPLAGADLEVAHNFGSAGVKNTSVFGAKGTYGLYAEAYRRAAKKRGILPREMQSITWEAVRGLFEAGQKKGLKAQVDAIWMDYRKKKINIETARARVLELAGGISPPSWVDAPVETAVGRTYTGRSAADVDSAARPPRAEGRVLFEVAPDPNDRKLTAEWNALPDEAKAAISRTVAAEVVPQALAELGTGGEVVEQIGGYLGATNPSLTVRLADPNASVRAAKLLGHVLSQDGMVVVSDTPVDGADRRGVITIDLPAGSDLRAVEALYSRLWELTDDAGEHLVGGHTTADAKMAIMNFSSLPDEEFARRIDEHLGGEYPVRIGEAHVAFIDKENYGYARDRREGQTATGRSPAQKRGDALKRAAATALRRELDARSGEYQQAGDGRGRVPRAAGAPLEGAPAIEGATGPDPRLVAVAEQYARDAGIPFRRQAEYVRVDPERARRIAAAYEAMPHAPQDPAVAEAYANLIQQTRAQYDALAAAGYQFYFFDPEGPDPYASMKGGFGNPWNAIRDLRANQRMAVFPTEAGFGTSDFDPANNPLLADTGLTWPSGSPDGQPKRVLANDLFRAVHDAFGHGLEGAGFRAQGEENAWQAHARLFTGSALGALTSETRGQNSWLNFGPYGEANQTAKVEDTVFADQKTGLMPEWTWTEGVAADEPTVQQDGELAQGRPLNTDTPEFKAWFGDSKVVDAEGKPLVVYHGTARDFSAFDPRMQGTSGQGSGEPGLFFEASADNAARYGSNVMPVYLSLRNPLIIERGNKKYGYDGSYNKVAFANFIDDALEFGHDGVIFRDVLDRGDRSTQYVAFRPEQIKSVYNRGTFDPADPNILNQSAVTEAREQRRLKRVDTPAGWPGYFNADGIEIAAFKAWFGDSKVVDAEGKPLVVYHGTGRSFSRFKSSKRGNFGPGIYLASDADQADAFAYGDGDTGANIMPLYVSIKRPFYTSADYGVGEDADVDSPAVPLIREVFGKDANKVIARLRNSESGHLGDAVRKRLEEAGHDGIIATYPDGSKEYVAFRPEQIKSVYNRGTFDPSNPDILEQGPRGTFNPRTLAIRLLDASDMSTFLHEAGHAFLEIQFAIAARPDAPAAIRDDAQALLKWFGVESLDEWAKMSVDQKRPSHEKFALSFERYLFSGEAPSIELAKAFQKFRDWLTAVYRSITQFLAQYPDAKQLNPAIKSVMDRMLATDEQIAQAEQARALLPLFEDPESSGMTPEAWAAYQAEGEEGHDDAIRDLEGRRLRDLKWLRNARGRVLKDLRKGVDEKRAAMRKEVEAEIRQQPVYAAMHFLRYGKFDAENLSNTQRRVLEAASLDSTKLSAEALRDMYGENDTEGPWRKLPYGKNGMVSAKGGLHPNDVALLFGFRNGYELVQALVDADDFNLVVDAATDQRLLETYGDIASDAALNRAADLAIHNVAYGRMLATELEAVDRLANPRRATGTDQRGRKQSVNMIVKAAKEFAASSIARLKIRDVKPLKYTAAEARAGRAAMDAMKKGDTQLVAAQKRNQVLQHHMAKEAYKAQEEIEKGVEYLRKFEREGTRKSLDIDYLDQIDGILERFELRKRTNRELDRRRSLAEWVAEQEEVGIVPDLPPEIMNERNLVNYREMTVEQFRGLVDSIKQIEHLGRLKKKLLTAKDQREFDAVRDEMVARIRQSADGRKVSNIKKNEILNKAQWGVRWWFAWHRKMASVAKELDGFTDGGPVWEYVIRSMNEAGEREAVMREQATIKLMEILAPVLAGESLGGKGVHIPEIGRAMNREERLAVALNVGNAGNWQRLTGGEGWTEAQVRAILATLTRKDLEAVQKIWDFFETEFKPQVAEKERRVAGKVPDWVEPQPIAIQLATGEVVALKGGYFPIVYDPNRSARAQQFADADEAKQQMRAAYTAATTRRSFTKSRAEEVTGRPLQLSLAGLWRGTEEVIHDLTHHEWLIDANRLLRDPQVTEAILEGYGAEYLRTINDTVKDVATGDSGPQKTWEPIINHFRAGATIVGLGLNVLTAALQVTGYTNSLVRVGAVPMARGLKTYLQNPMAAARMVYEKSNTMRLRAKTFNREINEIRNKVEGKGKVRELAEASSFFMITKMQTTVDIPTWLGAYEAAMQAGNDEKRAIALADQAVIDAQGGGQVKDLAAIQRGNAFAKLFTNFYSYFSVVLNLGIERTRATDFRSPVEVAALARDYLLLYTLPALMGLLIKDALKAVLGTMSDDDEEEYLEELPKRLAAEQISYLMGLFVGLREITPAVQKGLGVGEGAFNYGGPAGGRLFQELDKLGTQAGQGEADMALFKALSSTAGVLFHLPTGQVNRTVDGAVALIDGRTDNPGVLLTGAPRQ